MNRYPYEVGVLKKMDTRGIQSSLRRLAIADQLFQLADYPDKDHQNEKFLLRGLFTDNDDIPLFYQPMAIDTNNGKVTFVIDLRTFTKDFTQEDVDGLPSLRLKVGGNSALRQSIMNAILSGMWLKAPYEVTNISPFPCSIYGSLIANAVASNLKLEPDATMMLMAAFHIFYVTRCDTGNSQTSSPDEYNKLSLSLSRQHRIDAVFYQRIFQDMNPAEDLINLETFMKFIQQQQWSVRLKKLSHIDIMNLCRNMWTGVGNAMETIAVALEYPPTFMSILYAVSANQPFYRKTALGERLRLVLNKDDPLTYVKQIRNFTRTSLN